MSKKLAVPALFIAVLAFLSPRAEAIMWKYNLQDALKAAKSLGKPVMIDFYTDWCGWCKKLDSDTYTDPKVNAAAAKFICVKINAEREPALAGKYGVSGYPTVIFLDSNGNLLQKIPGFLPPDRFLAAMNRILATMPKPIAKIDEKPPVEAGGFAVIDSQAAGKGRGGKTPSRTVGQEFAYNGYIRSGSELTAQINYKGNTYFVKKGDNFAEFQVVSADMEKVVLASDNGTITLEYKKPYTGKGFMEEISKTITQPSETRSLTDTVVIGGSLPEAAAGKVRALISTVTFGIFIIFYMYFSLCLQLMAGKTKTSNVWMAWIPVLNFFLMLNISRLRYRVVLIPLLTFFAFIFISAFTATFNPLVGLAFAILILLNSLYFVAVTGYIWYKIAVACGKSPGLAVILAVLMFISPLNLIAIGYLAFAK